MAQTINFDMDGTIANLYGVAEWLPKLRAEDPTPYTEAKPLVNMATLARMLNAKRREGHKVGIISWLPKNGSAEYCEKVAQAKREWLTRHLPSVKFDFVDILAYGTPKQNGHDGVLFDDEQKNRDEWNGTAFDVNQIFRDLKGVA